MVKIIKGVNYRVVEVAGLENEYFDKAILYVKADKCESSKVKIDLEARQALTEIIPKKMEINKSKKTINKIIIACTSAVVLLLTGILSLVYFVL